LPFQGAERASDDCSAKKNRIIQSICYKPKRQNGGPLNLNFITHHKKFAPFFWTQFLGAFNDNFLKNALVVLVAFRGVQLLGLDSGALVAIAGGLFILPFFLFSPIAGQISDKYERSRVVRATKVLEIVIMILAAVAFLIQSYLSLLFLLFLMGTQSTFFGPAKYSLIPELVSNEDLTEGNALIELGTFLAILLGTIGGGMSAGLPGADWVIAITLVLISLVGYWTSRGVPQVPVGESDLKIRWNPFPVYIHLWQLIRVDRSVFYAVLAISWFWFFGAGVLSVLPIYVKDYLMGTEAVVTLFLAMFTLGVGVGSMLCERLSFKRVELGLVPIGSLGLTLFLFDIYWVGLPWGQAQAVSVPVLLSSVGGWRLVIDFFMMSISGGLFIVPLYTLVQERSESRILSRIISANNILNSLLMVVSSGLVIGLYSLGLNTAQVFGALSILNVIVALLIYASVPEFTLRFYSWVVSRILYGVQIEGERSVSKRGASIVLASTQGRLDWLVLWGAFKQPLRFVVSARLTKKISLGWLLNQAKVISVSDSDLPQARSQLLAEMKQALSIGQPVCIFMREGGHFLDQDYDQWQVHLQELASEVSVPFIPVSFQVTSQQSWRKSVHIRC
jgi:MFS family permease